MQPHAGGLVSTPRPPGRLVSMPLPPGMLVSTSLKGKVCAPHCSRPPLGALTTSALFVKRREPVSRGRSEGVSERPPLPQRRGPRATAAGCRFVRGHSGAPPVSAHSHGITRRRRHTSKAAPLSLTHMTARRRRTARRRPRAGHVMCQEVAPAASHFLVGPLQPLTSLHGLCTRNRQSVALAITRKQGRPGLPTASAELC